MIFDGAPSHVPGADMTSHNEITELLLGEARPTIAVKLQQQ
jgi:hypothetical protein